MCGVKHLKVLIIDDEQLIHESLGCYLGEMGLHVENAYDGASAIEKINKGEFGLVLLDVVLPGQDGMAILEEIHALDPQLSVVMMTGHGTMEMAVQALRNGASDFLCKPIKLRELDAVLEKARRLQKLQDDKTRLKETIGFLQKADYKERGDWNMVGESESAQEIRHQIEVVVNGQFDTILLTGETGTGKEVVARELHKALGQDKPFIAVSCPAIPESLIESELFGYSKGAFTGAQESRPGSFEMADNGILFLDEIAELSASAQAKMLRVLETRSVKRVGSARERRVNVTIIAATNIPLETLVSQKRFRQDLFYRLNVFSIQLKPLRERPDDIVSIAEHFLHLFATSRRLGVHGITKEAKALLVQYSFPGNVRELRNVIERAAILQGSGAIEPDKLNFMPTEVPSPPVVDSNGDSSVDPTHLETVIEVDDFESGENICDSDEKQRIQKYLEECKWNRREAAKALDMPYSTFRYKLKKHNIS